jgi:hypothetical protein
MFDLCVTEARHAYGERCVHASAVCRECLVNNVNGTLYVVSDDDGPLLEVSQIGEKA